MNLNALVEALTEMRREMRELRSIELDEAKGARICTILTPAESRRKAAATALRELAERFDRERNKLNTGGPDSTERRVNCVLAAVVQWSAQEAESRADALWPRKGAGR